MPFYEKGDVRIHYEEAGSGFPLLSSPAVASIRTVAGLATHPFKPMVEFKDEYRVIAADLRNAQGRPVDGAACDRRGVGRLYRRPYRADGPPRHRQVHGARFCIGGPFIWNLLQRAATASSRRCRRSPAATARRCPASPTTTT